MLLRVHGLVGEQQDAYANHISVFIFTATSLHQRKCPNLGRYEILEFAPSHMLSEAAMSRRQRRSDLSRTIKRRTWQDNTEDAECKSTNIQVGCTSSDQTEMIIANTCEHEEIGKYE